MSNIYLTEPGTKVGKDGGQIVISLQSGIVKKLPVDYVENLILMSRSQVSYDAVCSIMKAGGNILYMDWDGSVMGSMGSNTLNQRQMLRQLYAYENESLRMSIASNFVKEKIKAQKAFIGRYSKQYRNINLHTKLKELDKLLVEVDKQNSIEGLLGIEGIASKKYFSVLGEYILRNADFKWQGRHRFPAPDPLNSMLSFSYSLLEKDVRRELSIAGLNASIGYLHSLDLRKDSLVYDLMEQFRPAIADRVVLKCLNLRMFATEDFLLQGNKCYFTREAKSKFIAAYEKLVGKYDDEESMYYQIRLAVLNFKKLLLEGVDKVA